MGHFQCVSAPQWTWAPTFCYFKIEVLIWNMQWTKSERKSIVTFFRGITLRQGYKVSLTTSLMYPMYSVGQENYTCNFVFLKVVRYMEEGHYHCHHDSEAVTPEKQCCLYGTNNCRLCRQVNLIAVATWAVMYFIETNRINRFLLFWMKGFTLIIQINC